MAYRIEVLSGARRDLKNLPREVLERIHGQILSLAQNPRPPQMKTLVVPNRVFYRIRSADYRLIYHVDDANQIVTVVRAGHRRDVYRRLPSSFGR